MGQAVQDMNPRRTRFFSSPNIQTSFGAHPTSYSVGTSFFLGVKQQEHKVNHSLPSSAKVKNVYSHTSTPPMCLLGMGKDNFTFLSFVNFITRYNGRYSVNLNAYLLKAVSHCHKNE